MRSFGEEISHLFTGTRYTHLIIYDQDIALLRGHCVKDIIAPLFFKLYTRIPLATHIIFWLPLTIHLYDPSGQRLN